MTTPERIYANLCMSPIGGHVLSGTFRLEPDEIAATQPYILATPKALAASPEVAALIAEARRGGWNAGVEAAGLACVSEHLEDPNPDSEGDTAYQHAVADCIAAIRTLKDETP